MEIEMDKLKKAVDDIKSEYPSMTVYEHVSLGMQLMQMREFSKIAKTLTDVTVSGDRHHSAIAMTNIVV